MTRKPERPAPIRIELDADPEQLTLLRNWVRTWLVACGCAESDALQIEMSVDEACANSMEAIRNLSLPVDRSRVCVELIETPDSFQIHVYDCAGSFQEAFDRARPISDYTDRTRRRGYGLEIIKTFMDHVHYEHQAGTGNRLVLVKQRTPVAVHSS